GARAPSASRNVCSRRRRAARRSVLDPPRRGVDIGAAAAYEAAERDGAILRERHGKARRRTDRDEDRTTGDRRFLNELEREAPAHAEHVSGERQPAGAERPPDHLVERVVPADVLARAEQIAGRGEEAR